MHRLLIVALSLALTLAACGGASPTPDRTVAIAMRDIAYSPAAIDVAKGDTIKFSFTNEGKLVHDAFVGDRAAQMDHEESMGSDGHDMHGSGGITVKPGKTGSITHTFKKAGTYLIGCHEAGHYAAGMKITINVA